MRDADFSDMQESPEAQHMEFAEACWTGSASNEVWETPMTCCKSCAAGCQVESNGKDLPEALAEVSESRASATSSSEDVSRDLV